MDIESQDCLSFHIGFELITHAVRQIWPFLSSYNKTIKTIKDSPWTSPVLTYILMGLNDCYSGLRTKLCKYKNSLLICKINANGCLEALHTLAQALRILDDKTYLYQLEQYTQHKTAIYDMYLLMFLIQYVLCSPKGVKPLRFVQILTSPIRWKRCHLNQDPIPTHFSIYNNWLCRQTAHHI